MRLHTFVALGLLLASTECLGYGLADNGPAIAGGTPTKRQDNDSLMPDDTSDIPSIQSPNTDNMAGMEGGVKGVFTVELNPGPEEGDRHRSLRGTPLLEVMVGIIAMPVNLAVSLHSKDTWLSSHSPKICTRDPVVCPVLTGIDGGEKPPFAFEGPPGLEMRAAGDISQLMFNHTTQWGFASFGIGMAWATNQYQTEQVAKVQPADGILGLGRGSTFLKALAQSKGIQEITTVALHYLNGKGGLVLGGYYPDIADGIFTKVQISTTEGRAAGFRPLVDIKIKEKPLRRGQAAVIDPLYPDIHFPDTLFNELVKEMGWRISESGGVKRAVFDSVAAPNAVSSLTIVVGGLSIQITPDNYNDAQSQPSFTTSGSPTIILGRPFFRAAYVVIDYSPNSPHFYVAQSKSSLANLGTARDISNIEQLNVETGTGTAPSGPGPTELTGNQNDLPENKPSGNKSSSGNSKPNIGAIAGGVLGGLLVIIAILAIILICLHRRKRRNNTEPKGGYGRAASRSGLRSISPSITSGIKHNNGHIAGGEDIRSGTSTSMYGEPEMGHAQPSSSMGGGVGSVGGPPNLLLPQFTPENTRLMEGYHGFSDNGGSLGGSGAGMSGVGGMRGVGTGGQSSSQQGFYSEDTDDEIAALRGFSGVSGSSGRRGGRNRDSSGSALSRSMSLNTVSDVDEFESVQRAEAGKKVPRLPIYTAPARGDGPL